MCRLLEVPLPEPDEEEDDGSGSSGDDAGTGSGSGSAAGGSGSGGGAGEEEEEVDEVAAASRLERVRDPLREETRARQKAALAYITNAARLIAPVVGGSSDSAPGSSAAAAAAASSSSAGTGSNANWAAGYDWVIDAARRDHPTVASELAICKALEYMHHKMFDRAIEDLKAFERKDVRLKARAATNLSFLYFLEGDVAQASRYANLAVKHDRYNAKALVNLGNCLMERGEFERAKELYLEAIGVEADCVEAIFNLGLVNKHLGVTHEALQAFEKLHTLVPSSPEVIYQIASLHEGMGNYTAAVKYFNYLISKVPTDPGALARLGQIFTRDDDETQAFHYHAESYRYFPVNLEVSPDDHHDHGDEDDANEDAGHDAGGGGVPAAAAARTLLLARIAAPLVAGHRCSASRCRPRSRRLPPAVWLQVISWLGVWYVKQEMYEKAAEFFERASEIAPGEVKWKLMVASCHRRMTNYGRALECYEAIHAQHPDDPECE